MSSQCRHFVQNAWKKELCSNCFKSREEHLTTQEMTRPIVAKTANSVKRVAYKVQGILRMKENNTSQVRSKRKNVAFPDSLTEVIGYDGGDDYCTDDDDHRNGDDTDDPDNIAALELDEIPDSEEERALGNLTRANTNFNTVTANLTGTIEDAKTAAKTFSSLMLGRTQKDGEGKKTTLLVSVKPFGGDDCVPTARRPSDKKTPEIIKPKPVVEVSDTKTESLSSIKPSVKKTIEKSSETTTTMMSTTTTITKKNTLNNNNCSTLGKIVDMPLITSTNLISVIREDVSNCTETQKLDQKRNASIARTPAIKKSENGKPRIIAQPNTDQNYVKNQKNLEMSNGVELNLSPIVAEDNSVTEITSFGKEISNYKTSNIADLAERKVEGEAASEKYPFEESRESAGEPDGKADEEVVSEPPALPKNPPPIESNFIQHDPSKRNSIVAEPRPSFLHGATEARSKPTVPQKPVTLPSKTVGSSLASLLSENRAYEFRLSQSQRALAHTQSESQLCAGDDVASKSRLATGQSAKISAESCSQLTQSETFKAVCVKTVDKDDQQTTQTSPDEEVDAEEDEDSESSSVDQPRSTSKRRMAPQPPNSIDETGSNLFARNPAPNPAKSDCPVVREKEKRERASSCSPKFRKAVCEVPDPGTSRPPEPAPRRNISLSQDSLALAANNDRVVEEKKKGRSKFSLKKFLRMGTRKDVDMTCGSSGSRSDEIPSTPQPKPRLEIIHPLELDGAAVQVLRNDKSNAEDTTDSKTESHTNNSQPVHGPQHITTRPSKPPPPPRAQSLDESSRPNSRVTQPKQNSNNNSKPLTGKSWQPNGGSSASDSIYANLGKFRPIQCN